MDILQQKLIGYPSRVNYTKIIENCKTRQRDYFKTRTFYTDNRYIHTYVYVLFLFFSTNFHDRTRVKRRNGTIFLALSTTWRVPRSFQMHILCTCAPHSSRQSLLPTRPPPSLPLSFPPSSLLPATSFPSRSPMPPPPPLVLHCVPSAFHTIRCTVSPTLRARVSLAPFNHATPPSSPAALFTSQSCWNNTCAR